MNRPTYFGRLTITSTSLVTVKSSRAWNAGKWYQWEVLHLSVDEAWEGKGLASLVYERLEKAARSAGVRLLQCTIREGNKDSVAFFDRRGFSKIARFLNRQTGNAVGVWQKVLIEPGP